MVEEDIGRDAAACIGFIDGRSSLARRLEDNGPARIMTLVMLRVEVERLINSKTRNCELRH